MLTPNEEVHVESFIPFYDKNGILQFKAVVFAYVMKEKILFEIRHIEEFSHEHFLVCASYMVAQNADSAFLWNIRDNRIYSVSIPDKQAFMNAVAVAVTKGKIEESDNKYNAK